MRLMWHSNAPWIRTGYGCQTAIWVPRIAALGHEIIISGPFSFAGSPMAWGDFTVLPGAQDPFGSDVLMGHYRRYSCDLLITLCDVFMMEPAAMKGLQVVHWLPVDCEPMGKLDAEKAKGSVAQIAMSRFGEAQMRKAGFDPFYIPHGIETSVFCPPEDRAALRDELGFSNDQFLIGLNAANKEGPRKAIQEQVIAFSQFHKKHPESRLLVHSFASPKQGLDIKKLADELGVLSGVMMPDQYSYACGMMDTPVMARWYGMLDLLSNASYGEGFGLPLVEAQACGTPVVVTEASSMPELCGAGWRVGGEPYWVSGHDSFWTRPAIGGILGAYESAYSLWEAGDAGVQRPDGTVVTMAQVRAEAREFAVQYDADLVLEQHWKPMLEILDERRPKTTRLAAEDRQDLEVPVAGDGKRDLLLVVPSRGRPGSVERLVKAVADTSALRTDIVFGFDDDDPDLQLNLASAVPANDGDRNRVTVVVGERKGLAEWTNALAMQNTGKYTALGSFGDDHEPQTSGWDAELLKALAASGPGVAYPNDLVRDDIPQAFVVSSEIIDALGWFCEPSLKHYFVDNTWADLGQYARCITYLPDVIVEHQHHLRHPGTVERDDTYRSNEKKFANDQVCFEKWRAEGFADDIAKIKAVREAHAG